MFGVSFTEIMLIACVALIVVGPQKLPGMLRTLGEWVGQLRRLTTDMRAQTGIDDILREEGIDGVAELRSLLRGELHGVRSAVNQAGRSSSSQVVDPYAEVSAPDPDLEYPVEGPDVGGALADDLFQEAGSEPPEAEATPTPSPPSDGPTGSAPDSPSADAAPERAASEEVS